MLGKDYAENSGPGQRTRKRDHHHSLQDASLRSSSYVSRHESGYDQYTGYVRQLKVRSSLTTTGHFFEMARTDAERALEVYKNFTKQTDFVVGYLSTARQYEHQTRVEVPKLKHAPLNLVRQLEEYLKDPDFEVNRRQYLAEQDTKKFKGVSSKPFKSETESRAATGRSFPDAKQSSSKPAQESTPQPAKGPDPDLIDFFESIEQNQQPMAQQQHQPNQYTGNPFPMQQPQQHVYQQNGFGQQNGFQGQSQFPQTFNGNFNNGTQQPQQVQQPQTIQSQPLQQHQQIQPQQVQTNFTGAGFGGYTPQPFQPGSLSSIPQDSTSTFQSQPQQLAPMQTAQNTNPFRQSMMMNNTGSPSFGNSPMSPVARQSTNPFAKSLTPPNQQPFSPPNDQFQQAPLIPSVTGTNPFAKNLPAQRPQTSAGLAPQPTGNTNPFRQSQFVNTATGMGWQNNQQPIGGGLDHLETVPVFPRPAQQQAWQQ